VPLYKEKLKEVLVQMKYIKRSKYIRGKITEKKDGSLSNQNNQIEYYGIHGVM
jgi:hypothetical protein